MRILVHAVRSPRPWRLRLRLGLLALPALIAACGGGGGAETPAAVAPAPSVLQQQSMAVSKGVIDSVRVGWMLAADVQNIIVWGPVAIAQPAGPVACGQGGTLTLEVLRPASDPAGARFRQHYAACRESGILIQGTLDVSYTLSTAQGSTQPWAGSVRFETYSIASAGRQREYHGLATAQGEVRSVADGQSLQMRLEDFRLRDTPDTLGLGVTYTTARFDLTRLLRGALQDGWELGGRWLLEAGGLQASLDIQPGSRLGLLENSATDSLNARVSWTQGGLAPLTAGLSVLPAGLTALRVSLDLNEDGTPEHTATYDRGSDLGLRL